MEALILEATTIDEIDERVEEAAGGPGGGGR
jgi:hypothetical protein